MEQLAKEFRDDLKSFQEATKRFYAKEMSVKDYKGFSGGFGSYAQRGGEASMLRLRMPGGRLTKEKLKFVADMIEEYQINKVHFTTCQTIQLHNLDEKSVCEIMEKAIDVGILTLGGGGDNPRNVMVSPLAGVEKGEYFDVSPYASEASDFLMTMIKKIKMPRKLKVAFSNSPKNAPHATFRDLGFVAKENHTFDVYSAGGLGNNPRMGVLVAEDVCPDEILYYIKAMIETFCEYGNYENRGKARTRYMQEVLGDKYKDAFLEKLALVKQAEGDALMISAQETPVSKCGDGTVVKDRRIIEQKQEGLFTVSYHTIGGVPEITKFRELYETIKDMDEVEIRIAPDETIYMINLTGEEAKKVLAVTNDGAKDLFETSVSCIGSSICQVGLRNSQGLLNSMIEAVRKENFADGVLPRIHISGCPSSCGTHQIGTIGFHGSVKRTEEGVQPAFKLHVNGCDLQGQERFGKTLGDILETEIPSFMVEVGKAVEAEGTTFDKWFEKDPEKFMEIAKKYL